MSFIIEHDIDGNQRFFTKQEDDLKQLLLNSKRIYKIDHSTLDEDRYGHWDLICYNKNGTSIKIDVKSIKSENFIKDDSINWLEEKNISGHAGWLYGDADYIAFETTKTWIIVKRKTLSDFYDRVLQFRTKIFRNSYNLPFYVRYQRIGNLDIIMKVKTNDLEEISSKILNKKIL